EIRSKASCGVTLPLYMSDAPSNGSYYITNIASTTESSSRRRNTTECALRGKPAMPRTRGPQVVPGTAADRDRRVGLRRLRLCMVLPEGSVTNRADRTSLECFDTRRLPHAAATGSAVTI